MKKKHLLLLSLLSALLLSFGWVSVGVAPLLFVALVPLFLIEDYVTNHRKEFGRFTVFGLSFLAFLLWNIITTYWVWYATPMAVLAFTINSGLQAWVFHLYHYSRKAITNGHRALGILAAYWLAYEFFHLRWDLSWPWLNLGNGFANTPQWIQWYEYTGALGGSLWILGVNAAIFSVIARIWFAPEQKKKIRYALAIAVFAVVLPIWLSLYRYLTYEEKINPVEVVVVQPNIDPYSEQYNILPTEATLKMLQLAQQKITPETRLIVTPESMIQEYVWEDQVPYSPSIQLIQGFLREHPQTELLAGMSSYRYLLPGEEHTPATRSYNNEIFYEAHNTAVLITPTKAEQLYYKSKLTPGAEIMPFVKYIKPMEKLAVNLGGIIGTLGISEERKVFYSENQTPPFSPVICYESVYGEFVSEFVKNGAEFICIITNDGWWKNTFGHRQHAAYARLRAIETRRDIARSANTGISCFINQRGDVFQKTKYWTEDVIAQKINANKEITFFVKYGDYLGRLAWVLTGIFVLLTIVFSITNRRETKRLGV